MSARIAYFKNVNQSVVDASQNETLNTLINQVASKADASALTSGLAQKADSSAVTYGLALKADSSAVTSALALKADSSAVSTVATALAQEVTDRTNADALKLATSVYNARIVNEAVFFDSVANSIVLQDVNGAELNYVALGLVPA